MLSFKSDSLSLPLSLALSLSQTFQSGMQLYLSRHLYSNTSTTDMWAALSEASGEDIGQLMATWTQQMGFPLIKVKIWVNLRDVYSI